MNSANKFKKLQLSLQKTQNPYEIKGAATIYHLHLRQDFGLCQFRQEESFLYSVSKLWDGLPLKQKTLAKIQFLLWQQHRH